MNPAAPAGLGPGLAAARVLRRQEHHRDRRESGVGLERGERLVAVHPGHHHVEQDRVGPFPARRVDAGRAAVGGDDRHPRRAQADLRHQADILLVVYHQYFHVSN